MKQILIVDDAVTVRMYHKDLMTKCGFASDEAANGIEALEKVLSKEFDLLIVDVNMPKMSNCFVLRRSCCKLWCNAGLNVGR